MPPPKASRPSRRSADLLDGATASGQIPADGRPGAVRDDLVVERPHRAVPRTQHTRPVRTSMPAFPHAASTVIAGPSGCGKSTLLGGPRRPGAARPAGACTSGGTPPAGPHGSPRWPGSRSARTSCTARSPRTCASATPTPSDDQLWSALRRVALEERVRDLPGGLHAAVGEDGKLALGRRAGTARPGPGRCCRPARGCCMDEPTAHLDELTELVIADTIVELGRTSGVVVVAHDPAMLALADQLLVLEPPARRRQSLTCRASPGTDPTSRPSRHRGRGEAAPAAQPPATFWSSTLLGALASASGVALTATAGWLIVQASTRPAGAHPARGHRGGPHLRPGPARAALRRTAALPRRGAAAAGPTTGRRLRRAWSRSFPGGSESSRGDVLDLGGRRRGQRRGPRAARAAAGPLLRAWSGCSRAVAAGALLPSPDWSIAVVCGGSAVVAFAVARTGAARAEEASIERRAELSRPSWRPSSCRSELVMWQRTSAAAARRPGQRPDGRRPSRRAGSWAAAARAWLVVTTGVAIAIVGDAGRSRVPRRCSSAPRWRRCWSCCPWPCSTSRFPSPTPARSPRGPAPPRAPGRTGTDPASGRERHRRARPRSRTSSMLVRVDGRLGDESLRCAASRSLWRPGHGSAVDRRLRIRQEHPGGAAAAFPRPGRGPRSASAESTCDQLDLDDVRGSVGSSTTTRTSSPPPWSRTSAWHGRRPLTRRSRSPAAGRPRAVARHASRRAAHLARARPHRGLRGRTGAARDRPLAARRPAHSGARRADGAP